MKTIAIANPAGGVGKSTLAHALAVAATEFGKKTLLIDLDPAGGLSFKLGFENSRVTMADLFSGRNISDEELITTEERFDFITADSRLIVNFGEDLSAIFSKNLPKDYDLIILDCPPSLTPSLAVALSTADHIFAPVMATMHSLRGLIQLRKMANIPVTSVGIGSVTYSECEPSLDATVDFFSNLESASISNLSILSIDKNSAIAESYRSAAYSVLEILGLE